jgi:hypothetical protein
MIDHEVESFVRGTFRDHEHLVDGALARLLPAVRARARRRGWIRLTGAIVATLGILGGAVITLSVSPAMAPSPTPSPTSGQGIAPAGWRVESSVGGEVAVPSDWVLDDYGCGMTAASTVVRSGLMSPAACFTSEPPGKQVASIQQINADRQTGPLPLLASLTEHGVLLDGLAATRAEGRLDDGRYAGWVWVPARNLAVVVKTVDPITTRQILDSVRLVDTVDHAGCELREPVATSGSRGTGSTFVAPNPTAISICYYADSSPPTPLDASTKIDGTGARQLAAVLNNAPPGPNADAPADRCMEVRPLVAELVLHLWVGDEIVSTVWITYGSCTHRGLFNGTKQAQMTHTLLRLIQQEAHVGYYLRADIPQ